MEETLSLPPRLALEKASGQGCHHYPSYSALPLTHMKMGLEAHGEPVLRSDMQSLYFVAIKSLGLGARLASVLILPLNRLCFFGKVI